MIFISIIEAIYLIFMFRYFETSVDFNILSSPKGYWFEHLIGNEKGKRICPFGQVAIIPLSIMLIARHYIYIPYQSNILLLAFGFSWMNLNATVYLLPILILEFFYNPNINAS